MTWLKGGSRRRPLPKDWARRRSLVLVRDPLCKACAVRPSTDADHIDPEGSDGLTNLQGLCAECHKAKTQREARAARRRHLRPGEPHPGLTAGGG